MVTLSLVTPTVDSPPGVGRGGGATEEPPLPDGAPLAVPAAAVLGVAAVPPAVEPDEGWPAALLRCGRRAAGPEVAVTAGAAVGVPGEAGVAAATVEETGVSDAVPDGEARPAPVSAPVAAPPAPPGLGANAASRYFPTSPAQAAVVLRTMSSRSARARKEAR